MMPSIMYCKVVVRLMFLTKSRCVMPTDKIANWFRNHQKPESEQIQDALLIALHDCDGTE